MDIIRFLENWKFYREEGLWPWERLRLLPEAATTEKPLSILADTTCEIAAQVDPDAYVANSDIEDPPHPKWPSYIEVLAACGCVLDFMVAGEELFEGTLVGCGSEACSFAWNGATQCAYKYLEDLKGVTG